MAILGILALLIVIAAIFVLILGGWAVPRSILNPVSLGLGLLVLAWLILHVNASGIHG
jgi:hypothetical protein